MFYDKKCNFYKRNQVTEDFVEKTVYTLLHENVDCDFFTTQLNNGEYEMESAKYEDGQLYIVVLPGGAITNIEMYDRIELIEPAIGTFGMYELYKNPQVYRLPNGYIDNITLHVNKC